MSLSVNTNSGALIALANLNQTSQQLQQAQNIVSTGLAVATAKDNGATWAIAQGERATIGALDAVKSSLQTGQSIIDVANSAGTTVSNLLTQMEQKALAASDQSLDTASRLSLNAVFVARGGIDGVILFGCCRSIRTRPEARARNPSRRSPRRRGTSPYPGTTSS